jgi:hypothetical protein
LAHGKDPGGQAVFSIAARPPPYLEVKREPGRHPTQERPLLSEAAHGMGWRKLLAT